LGGDVERGSYLVFNICTYNKVIAIEMVLEGLRLHEIRRELGTSGVVLGKNSS
jgi:hypothetical protein